MALWILLGVIGLLLIWVISTYNSLVRLRNQGQESWSGIDVQLKRRYDLIPNLVETVKGYAAHESGTLEKVIQARNSAIAAPNIEAKVKAEGELTGALRSIFALSESYPDLKANANFAELQKTLADIEDHLQNARRYYNAVARDLNTACEAFPSVIIANNFGFKKLDYFEAAAGERENVKVSFK